MGGKKSVWREARANGGGGTRGGVSYIDGDKGERRGLGREYLGLRFVERNCRGDGGVSKKVNNTRAMGFGEGNSWVFCGGREKGGRRGQVPGGKEFTARF